MCQACRWLRNSNRNKLPRGTNLLVYGYFASHCVVKCNLVGCLYCDKSASLESSIQRSSSKEWWTGKYFKKSGYHSEIFLVWSTSSTTVRWALNSKACTAIGMRASIMMQQLKQYSTN